MPHRRCRLGAGDDGGRRRVCRSADDSPRASCRRPRRSFLKSSTRLISPNTPASLTTFGSRGFRARRSRPSHQGARAIHLDRCDGVGRPDLLDGAQDFSPRIALRWSICSRIMSASCAGSGIRHIASRRLCASHQRRGPISLSRICDPLCRSQFGRRSGQAGWRGEIAHLLAH